MDCTTVSGLDEVPEQAWNALDGAGNPFLSYQFLVALERHGCVGPETAWRPCHLLIHDDGGQLLGAAPLYKKFDSWGEFVFDWSWADASQRAGMPYYPKLVCAVPFTPATGPRLLVHPDADSGLVHAALLDGGRSLAQMDGCSSLHWLFPRDPQKEVMREQGLLIRTGCQFHWRNRGYRDFQDFLDTLTSKKRKQIRRERRMVAEAGIEIRTLNGHEATTDDWDTFYRFYCNTFHERGHHPPLSHGFFHEIGRTLADHTVLVMCYEGEVPIAGAFLMRGRERLYGRHWGMRRHVDQLHFEACFYRGIDYAIANDLQWFEPGAQGQHKIARGFLPTATWSAHWIANPPFRDAVARFLADESEAMIDHIAELTAHSPYRQTC